MNYSKPEVTVLGPASLLIQGSFSSGKTQDPGSDPATFVYMSDCEVDD